VSLLATAFVIGGGPMVARLTLLRHRFCCCAMGVVAIV
jgi:hypothetical protein